MIQNLNTMQKYIRDLNKSLSFNDSDSDQLYDRILLLENQMIKLVKSTKLGKDVYMLFIKHILESDRGLINSRPYFRIRETNVKALNKAISNKDVEELLKFPINFQMCSFIIKNTKKHSGNMLELFENIKKLRDQLIQKFLPMSLIRAKSFNKTLSSSYELEDLIQIANEAVITAVDKYVKNETSNFKQVVDLRICGHLINNGAHIGTTSIGAAAYKKLYKIKSLLGENPSLTTKQISDIIKVSESEVADLIAATIYMSLDAQIEDTNNRYIDQISYDSDSHDYVLEKSEMKHKIFKHIENLNILEKKILVLKSELKISDYLYKFHSELIKDYTVLEKKILILKGEVPYENI